MGTHPEAVQILEVTGFGVRSAVIRLGRRGSALQFVIYPMVHMAEAAFYAAVSQRLATAQVIVAEGIRRGARRRPSVLATSLTMSYTVLKFNRRVRLVEQDIVYETFGVPVVCPMSIWTSSGHRGVEFLWCKDW